MRLMKYRIESLSLVPEGSLDEFLSEHAGDNAGAIGQEAGDLKKRHTGWSFAPARWARMHSRCPTA
jgi:hypothetical protein